MSVQSRVGSFWEGGKISLKPVVVDVTQRPREETPRMTRTGLGYVWTMIIKYVSVNVYRWCYAPRSGLKDCEKGADLFLQTKTPTELRKFNSIIIQFNSIQFTSSPTSVNV